MAQWINLKMNNRSVLVHQYSVLGEKTGPILLLLVGLMAGREGGRPADKMRVGFEIFKFLYWLNYSGFYFVCYHSNVTIVLELHFGQLLSSKVYFKVFFKCEKFISLFSCQSLPLGTSIRNDKSCF